MIKFKCKNGLEFGVEFKLGTSFLLWGKPCVFVWCQGEHVTREILNDQTIVWPYRYPGSNKDGENGATFREFIYWPQDFKEFCERLMKVKSFE